ncbi:hypothetical protein B0H11DRAFT_2022774 [Mycena galericulata]|nr:hypothetical protein B0H11DRAFT_2022774 [Mycena galericulata]
MSWTASTNPYGAFIAAATDDGPVGKPLSLSIWECDPDKSTYGWVNNDDGGTLVTRLRQPCKLRIVFAPLDFPQKSTHSDFVRLFEILAVPSAFVTEQLSVSHSFGAVTDYKGSCAWFHFLCKNIKVKAPTIPISAGGRPEVQYHEEADAVALEMRHTSARGIFAKGRSKGSRLPHADYSYLRSAFFLRTHDTGDITLVCFGATVEVLQRFQHFVGSGEAWADVRTEPYILFDVILEGLCHEVDGIVWNLNYVFGPLEHDLLSTASSHERGNMLKPSTFAGLHNLAKHAIYLVEALESCIILSDAILARTRVPATTGGPGLSSLREQLQDCLMYRKSFFQSTKLRLVSLDKRLSNAIALSFDLLTQQDSLIMIQDSKSMKTLAAITMVFLPATAVASIVGSQLFLTTREDDGSWVVALTPLFKILWYFTIPLTVLVFLCSWLLQSGFGHWGRSKINRHASTK